MRALESALCPWIHDAGNCGRGPWQAMHRRMPHYMLVVSYEGAEQVTVEGQAHEIPSGSAYLIQPGMLVEHFGSKTGNRPAYVHFDLVFNVRRTEYESTSDFATDLGPRSHLLQPTLRELFDVDVPVCIPEQAERAVARQVDGIVEDWLHGGELGQLRANANLLFTILDLVQLATHTVSQQQPLGVEERLRRAETLARASLNKGFTSEDFARHAGFSRTHFSRIYRNFRGQSPGEALRDMRLSEAERVLRETRLSVAEVARLVGLPDASALARAFRLRHGQSPSEWRARA